MCVRVSDRRSVRVARARHSGALRARLLGERVALAVPLARAPHRLRRPTRLALRIHGVRRARDRLPTGCALRPVPCRAAARNSLISHLFMFIQSDFHHVLRHHSLSLIFSTANLTPPNNQMY